MGRSGKGKGLKKQGLNRKARKSKRKEKYLTPKQKQRKEQKLWKKRE